MKNFTLHLLLKAVIPSMLFMLTFSSTVSAQALLLDPLTQPQFVNPLPVPGVIDATNGGTFTITMTEFTQDLGLVDPVDLATPLLTKVWGYNNTYPGPTIRAMKDVPVNVFWLNNLV
ncbi:MAG TPA: multicopper oxidase domain-containing protein, partial [Bacteroidales bacterium]|nr:multicopper oxidase domain-containing protein [Bacteroidales bacterium]